MTAEKLFYFSFRLDDALIPLDATLLLPPSKEDVTGKTIHSNFRCE